MANKIYEKEEIQQLNNYMIEKSRAREQNRKIWKTALKSYVPLNLEKIDISMPYKLMNPNTADEFKESNKLISLLIKKYINFKAKDSYKDFIKILCKAVYRSLIQKNMLDKTAKIFIKTEGNTFEYGIKNVSTYEQMFFLKTVKESLSININSRYLVEFYGRACSVPELFDKNKVEASIFFNNLKVLKKNLIYTKTKNGKRILLKYRLQLLKSNSWIGKKIK